MVTLFSRFIPVTQRRESYGTRKIQCDRDDVQMMMIYYYYYYYYYYY